GAEGSLRDADVDADAGRHVGTRRDDPGLRPDDRVPSLKCFQRRQHLQAARGRFERRPLALDRERRRPPEALVRALDALALALQDQARRRSEPFDGPLQPLRVALESAPDATSERLARAVDSQRYLRAP